jgi:hypothetical protein
VNNPDFVPGLYISGITKPEGLEPDDSGTYEKINRIL